MLTKAQKVRLAVFFVLGLALLVTLAFVIAGQLILNPTVTYYVEFRDTSVSGLGQGTPVQYNGIEVGSVRDVRFAEDSVERVVATISVRRDVPIKRDAKAQLRPTGIAGGQQVAFYGASDQAERLPPGSTIIAEQSTLEQVTEPAQDIVQQLNALLSGATDMFDEQNRRRVDELLTTTSRILEENRPAIRRILANADAMVESSGEPLRDSTADIRQATEDLAAAASKLRSATDTLLNNEEIDRIPEIVRKLDETVKQTQQSVSTVESMARNSERRITDSLRTLDETLDYLNNFAMQISEDPSRLVR